MPCKSRVVRVLSEESRQLKIKFMRIKCDLLNLYDSTMKTIETDNNLGTLFSTDYREEEMNKKSLKVLTMKDERVA